MKDKLCSTKCTADSVKYQVHFFCIAAVDDYPSCLVGPHVVRLKSSMTEYKRLCLWCNALGVDFQASVTCGTQTFPTENVLGIFSYSMGR